ncbi:hypothetical protein BDR26DRAFT_914051 [Obelidium mucronatum]|nr:hypothetical protein BDR26DRAFT_914051 [Obelidium mucronatum]
MNSATIQEYVAVLFLAIGVYYSLKSVFGCIKRRRERARRIIVDGDAAGGCTSDLAVAGGTHASASLVANGNNSPREMEECLPKYSNEWLISATHSSSTDAAHHQLDCRAPSYRAVLDSESRLRPPQYTV